MLLSKNSVKPTSMQGVVISIDVKRKVCKVITDDRRLLRNVPWYFPASGDSGRAGDNYTPMPRDRVIIDSSTGNPCIVSGAGINTYSKEYASFIASRKESIDSLDFFQRFNLSQESNDKSKGSSRPEDSQPGDRLITSQGGSLFGVLNSGSIIAKASALAQIFLSKMDDLVRIVSRNFELFTDASKRVDANVAGDVYNYEEYYRTTTSSRDEKPEYFEARGNTKSALGSKGNYVGQIETLGMDDIIKFQAVEEDSKRRWTHTLNTIGHSIRRSQNASGSLYGEETLSDTEWNLTIKDGSGRHLYRGNTSGATISCEKLGKKSVLSMGSSGTTTLETTDKVEVITSYAIIRAPLIDLGDDNQGVLEKVVLGDTLASWFTTFQLQYTTHTHTGNLGAPTTPPMEPIDFTSVLPNGASYSTKNKTQ